jgi:aldose 1-epimerase
MFLPADKHPIERWGTIGEQEICKYRLRNASGIQIDVINFGATITSISTPDRDGNFADITLGYDDLQGYIDDRHYMGGIVGRYANRIAGSLIELDGKAHHVTIKPGGYHHHGGTVGFNKKIWTVIPSPNTASDSIKMEYLSVDGEEGFPGNLRVTVTFTLNDSNQLLVDYTATTDQTTIINITQHPYFNLTGLGGSSILNHKLMMPLNSYLPVNKSQVPNGEVRAVKGTPFDFKNETAIGERIDNAANEQLTLSDGYDHSWVIKNKNSAELKVAARVVDTETGRVLTIYTTEPAVHLYTGNGLDGAIGKEGAAYIRRSGFCLETQHYPDSPNRAHFPSTVLRKGEVFKSKTVFEFGVSKQK